MAAPAGGAPSPIPAIRTPLPTNRNGPFPMFTLIAPLILVAGLPGQVVGPPPEEAGARGPAALVETLRRAFVAEPDSPEARARLWTLARRAEPTPGLMDALGGAAADLGPTGWTAVGVLARRGLRPLDALEAFDRAAVSPQPPGVPVPDIEAGRLLAELRCHERALVRFARYPDHLDAMRGQAVVLARLGRTEEAFALADALLRRDEADSAAVMLRAELLDSEGRGDEAVESLRRLAAETEAGGPAGSLLGKILVRSRRAGEAVPYLEAATERTPDDAEARFALGRARLALGEPDAAEALLRRVLEDDPALNAARLELARLVRRRGGADEATRLFAEFERRRAESDRSSQLLGEAEFRPDDFRAVSAFVVHALRIGDRGLALRGAQRFLIEFPDDPDRHVLLARVWREIGNPPEAERVLRRALTRFAADPAAERRLRAALTALARAR